MIKVKPIIFCATAAFVFSFFTALIFRSPVAFSLLKGVIFAAVFAGVAAGTQFLYGKFLAEGNKDSLISESAEAEKPRTGDLGAKVNLVVSEEDLAESEGALPFALDSDRHILREGDVQKNKASQVAKQNATFETVAPSEKNAESATKENAAFQNGAAQEKTSAQNQNGPPQSGQNDLNQNLSQKSETQNEHGEGFVPMNIAKTASLSDLAQSSEKENSSEKSAEGAAQAVEGNAAFQNGAAQEKKTAQNQNGPPQSGQNDLNQNLSQKNEGASPVETTVQVGQKSVSSKVANAVLNSMPDLDDLPEFSEEESAQESEGDIIEDSEFTEEGMTAKFREERFSGGKIPEIKDAATMAKAIQTALKGEGR